MTRGSDTCFQIPRLLGGLVVLCLVLLKGGCAPYHTDHLDQAIGQATQDDIRKGLGPPQTIRPLAGGDTEWVYYDRGSATVGYAGKARSKTCRELVLLFDRELVLRTWTQQACRVPAADPRSPAR